MTAHNIFWRNTRTEKHRPDDPLSTDPPAAPPVNPPISRRGCVCEFCECTLAPSGEVLKVGDKAKLFRRHDEAIEKKDKEISRLETEVADLKAKLQAATGSPAPSTKRVGALVE